MPPAVTVGFIVVAAVVVFFVVNLVAAGARKRLSARVEEVVAEGAAGRAIGATESLLDQRRRERLPALANLLKGKTFYLGLERKLVSAGVPLRPTEFMVIVAVSTAGMVLISLLFARRVPVLMVGLVFVGYMLPHWVLNFLRNRRRRTLEMQLADALTMIASGLRAGYGFLQGLNATAEQLPDPIASEFRRVVRNAQMGMELSDALERMGARVQSYDYDMTITAACIQLRTGGNLAGLLQTIAETVRERIKLRREISAATAEGRMSGSILVLLPLGIAVALMVLNRDYAGYLFQTPEGRNMLKGAVVMQFLGIWVIKKLLDFEG